MDAFSAQDWTTRRHRGLGREQHATTAQRREISGGGGMALLDKANTSAYGNPEMTKVNIGVSTRPAILVSMTLETWRCLSRRKWRTGIDVYTIPCWPVCYPASLRNIPALCRQLRWKRWWKQKEEFDFRAHPRLLQLYRSAEDSC